MDFQRFVRKYVWNDEKTPYLTKVGRLTKRQARSELFIISILIAAFFFVIGMAALLGVSIVAGSIGIAVYAFAVCSAALILAATHHPIAALAIASAPPVVLLFLLVEGFPPQLHMLDKVLIAVVLLALSVYMLRVRRIANIYPGLEEGPDPAMGPRL
jgi:hypothetical protein